MFREFSTEGFDALKPGVWGDPRSGDALSLVVNEGPLSEPVWLEDVPGMRASLAQE